MPWPPRPPDQLSYELRPALCRLRTVQLGHWLETVYRRGCERLDLVVARVAVDQPPDHTDDLVELVVRRCHRHGESSHRLIEPVDLRIEIADLGVEMPDLGIEMPDLGIEMPDLRVEMPDLAIEMIDLAIEMIDLRVEMVDLLVELAEHNAVSAEDHGVSAENLDVPPEHLRVLRLGDGQCLDAAVLRTEHRLQIREVP